MPRYDEALEYRRLSEQTALQAALLQRQLTYILERSPYYRKRHPDLRPPASPEEALNMLRAWPTTTRDELAEHNEDFLCVDSSAIREIVCTSGTVGRSIALPLTCADLDKLAVTEQYAFMAAGLTPSDTVLLCVTMNALFMAGMAYYLGLQRVGCTVLRQGAGSPAFQLDLMRRFRVTAVVTVPSFLLAMLKEARRTGLDASSLPLKKAVLVGDALRTRSLTPNAMARAIHELWNIELYGSYGNTEMCGSLSECSSFCGNHVHPDMTLVEILNDDGTPVAPGEEGSVVVTPLQMEGAPVVRYRTGDIGFLVTDPCACGRQSIRLGPILAREDQMLKIRGTKVYPLAVREIILETKLINQCVLVADSDEHGGDRLTVMFTPAAATTSAQSRLTEHLANALRVRPQVIEGTEEQLAALMSPPNYRKKRWFVDQRSHTPRT